jgi:hypothetical protein
LPELELLLELDELLEALEDPLEDPPPVRRLHR